MQKQLIKKINKDNILENCLLKQLTGTTCSVCLGLDLDMSVSVFVCVYEEWFACFHNSGLFRFGLRLGIRSSILEGASKQTDEKIGRIVK